MNKLIASLSTAALLGSSAFVTPAFGQGADASVHQQTASSAYLACMSAAVNARGSAYIAARTKFNTSFLAALTAHQSAMVSAYTVSNNHDRNAAIRAAKLAFKASIASARAEYRLEMKMAWNAYFNAKKLCKPMVNETDGDDMPNDNT